MNISWIPHQISQLIYVKKYGAERQLQFVLKGVVHPKKLNSIVIYSPATCSKPVWVSSFCLFATQQVDIFKNVGNQTAAIDLTMK